MGDCDVSVGERIWKWWLVGGHLVVSDEEKGCSWDINEMYINQYFFIAGRNVLHAWERGYSEQFLLSIKAQLASDEWLKHFALTTCAQLCFNAQQELL